MLEQYGDVLKSKKPSILLRSEIQNGALFWRLRYRNS